MKPVKLTLAFVLFFAVILSSIALWTYQSAAAASAIGSLPPPIRSAFLTGPTTGNPLEIALTYLAQTASDRGVDSADIANLLITDHYTSQHNGVTHIYVRQQVDGLQVIGANGNIHIAADGSVINEANQFIPHAGSRAATRSPHMSAVDATYAAAAQLDLVVTTPVVALQAARGPSQAQLLSDGGMAQEPISAELVYVPHDNALRLAWNLIINENSGAHWWETQVDAVTGEMLGQVDWVVSEAWEYPQQPASDHNPSVQHTPTLPTTGPAYLVFPMPLIDAQDGGFNQTLVTDSADVTASPYGWHDTDGAPGAEFTDTRGNNVFAQEDVDRNNVGGFRPNGGDDLIFDYLFDPAIEPDENTNQAAAIVNLFYWNNVLHDVFYGYGFDEAAGNFQHNNYGHEGLAGDPVQADAQDGSGTNNANFATPPDGLPSRMQMFVWTAPPGFSVTAPPELAGQYDAASAGFGPSLNDLPPISGTLILGDDGSDEPVTEDEGSVTDGCQPLLNAADIAGNIVVLDRGNCYFTTKVLHGQEAGAVAVLIANNQGGDVVQSMGGSNPDISIPSLMITQNLGDSIKATLPTQAVSVALSGSTEPNRDSDFDNLIIAHEYGHGISNRLAGGPANSSCLFNSEQMGEGWSDFFGLWLTAKPTDTPEQPRGIGNYVMFQTPEDKGIRPNPYSTDLAINPFTFGDIGELQIPHGLGSVWGAMLWDMYWLLIDEYGYDADLVNGSGGNNLTLQLVLDGLKLQECNPTFTDGRDAILLADEVNNDGANRCTIWRAFAKRGLGVSADSHGKDVGFEVEAFDIPVECEYLYSAEPVQDICVGDTATYTVTVGASYDSAVDLSVNGYPDGSTALLSDSSVLTVPQTVTLTISDTALVTPAAYTVVMTGTGATHTDQLHLALNVADTTPGVTTLLTPTIGTLVDTLQPLLVWEATAQAAQYEVTIATDATFTHIVDSAIVRETEYRSAEPLPALSTLYWRVRSLNGCDSSVPSTTSTFDTRGFIFLPVMWSAD